jgi:hypothetical protein
MQYHLKKTFDISKMMHYSVEPEFIRLSSRLSMPIPFIPSQTAGCHTLRSNNQNNTPLTKKKVLATHC